MKSAPFRKTSVVLCALAALLLLPGCGGRSASIQQQGAVTLVETLTIGHDDSDDAFLFSSIPAVAVLDDGRIVLSDSQDPRLRLFNDSLVSVRRFGKLSAIMDPSSPLERQAASFASVVLDANAKTLVVAPRSYRCRLARYDWNEDTPVVSMLESQSCPDRGYRELTEAEFNDYRKLAEADDLGSIPGSLGASFTSEGKSYSLVWRVAEGVVMSDDGSVLVLVNAYANGWARRVDYFSAAGAFVGSFPIEGLPDDLKGGFVGSDNSGNWYYRSTSAEGLPGIKRFSVELELPEGS